MPKVIRFFAKSFFLIMLLFPAAQSFAGGGGGGSGAATTDVPSQVICNVIVFVQKLGLPIMTGVILGSSIMAIFGRLAWPAIAMLVVFTAIFFGAGKLIAKFAVGVGSMKVDTFECKENNTASP
ncbi:TrbC/VirB2 family protein [Anaplasma bovis]|uniref:TrbC/VirB2 family protein n=1 Tax=Anaplasma bovis TaxID=186733 RepID=UPI002FF352C4